MRAKSRFMLIASVLLLVVILPTTCIFGATPKKINYQGFLRSSGLPVNVTLNMDFDLYNAPAAGVLLCGSGTQAIAVSFGRFNYVIGTNGCDLSTIDWQTNSVYLEITVDGNTMSPREQVVASAYSLSNDSGTPETTFTLDVDNQVAGASSALAFNRGADSANDASIAWDEGNDRFSLTSDGVTLATVFMGTASATTYFGDGSNLTGIATGGGVAKTGDAMTGALGISQSAATASISVYQTNNTSPAGYFRVTGATNSGAALSGINDGNTVNSSGVYGQALFLGSSVYAYKSDSDGALYSGQHSGGSGDLIYLKSGAVPTFAVDYSGNLFASGSINSMAVNDNLYWGDHGGASGDLIRLEETGSQKFVVDNSGNVFATGSVKVGGGFVSGVNANGEIAFKSTGGNANGILIQNPGTQGIPARFIVNSGGNPNPVLTATTSSNARAAYFENGASTATVYIKQGGASGDLLAGSHIGGSGYLVNLTTPAGPTFVVDTSGNIFASGSLTLAAGGFVSTSGGSMTGGLKIDYDSTTAALHVRDGASPSNVVFIEDIGKNFATSTLYVKTNNANAGSYGIYSYTTGSGMPGYFQVDNGGNPADAIQATTNGGGSAFYGINTGTGSGGYFNINNAGNGSAAVDASTNGSGRAGWFRITNAGSGADVIDASTGGSGDAVQGTNTGIGRAGYFAISNAANSVSAMVVTTNGAGSAGSFSATNPGNTLAALAATNSGTAATSYGVAGTADGAGSGIYGYSASNGNGVYGYNSGTGIAGYFQVNNAASGGNAIYATSNGVGRAVDISITNATNVNSAMYVSHSGTGAAAYGENSSASTGKAGYFTNTNAANTVAALSGVTAGSSASSYGVFGQAMGAGSAIYGQNSGAGYGVYGYNTSTGYAVYGQNSSNTTGKAGYFTNSNAANTVAALTGITAGTSVTSYGVYGEAAGNGTGVVGKSLGGGTGITGENSGTLGFAAYFLNSNAGSTAPLISGNHNGSGKLLQLQKSAVEKFVVDNNGVVITQGCPAGMVNAGNYCIDANETASTTWDGAASACQSVGKQMCTSSQWVSACNAAIGGLNTMTDNMEWVDSVHWGQNITNWASMVFGSGTCNSSNNSFTGNSNAFRCCYSK